MPLGAPTKIRYSKEGKKTVNHTTNSKVLPYYPNIYSQSVTPGNKSNTKVAKKPPIHNNPMFSLGFV